MARPPVSREDRWRRAARFVQRAEREDRRAQAASDPDDGRLHRAAAVDLRMQAWHELKLGLNEPNWPDGQERLPLDVRALAAAVRTVVGSRSGEKLIEKCLEEILQVYEVEKT